MTPDIGPTELATLLERSAWFRAAPDALRAQLLEAGRTRRLPGGQRLLRGERRRQGSVAGRDRARQLVRRAQSRTHDACAERDTLLFHVPCAALAVLLERTPAFWHAFGLLLTHKLRLAFDAIEEAALLPAAQRVARRLLLMAGGYGDAGALRRVLKVPQEDLAMMLALSRQTTNQILRQFEAQGALALRYAEIEIVDAQKLGALAAHADVGAQRG